MTHNGASGCAVKAFSPNKSHRCLKLQNAKQDSKTSGVNFQPRIFVVPAEINFHFFEMQNLVEDFLQYLRHERGQSDNTAKTYAALLGKFVAWANENKITDWKQVELQHLMAFLQHERTRNTSIGRPVSESGSRGRPPHQNSLRKLSSESVYLEIAALRAFYRFAENEKILE